MELRAIWLILWLRWLVAVIPAGIVLLVGLLTYQAPPPAYNVGVRFLVAQPPAAEARELSDQERYYNWLASEYIVNGLADWVRGNRFGEAVSAELARQGVDIPAGAVQGGLVVDNARSMLLLSFSGGDPEQLAQIVQAAIVVMTGENVNALPQLGGTPAVLVQLDEPVVGQIPNGLRSQLDLPLRLLLAVAAGVGLAFLVDYLDPTVRGRGELEKMGLPLLGEIPRDK